MALEKQVSSLITLNDSVLTVAQAIQNLTNLMTGTGSAPTMGIPQQPTQAQATTVQSDMAAQNAALLASVQSLAQEVATLRAEQAAQTSAMIAANYEANMANADAVVSGTADIASTNSYAERANTKLA